MFQLCITLPPLHKRDVHMDFTLDTELSEKEIYAIGSIVAQWGFIETEIFEQTLLSYKDDEDLPAQMKNNAQFSKVLQLWQKRVAKVRDPRKKEILIKQYEELVSLNKFRQAVVHSRWEWSRDDPGVITAVRYHNQSVKRIKFTLDDLVQFTIRLGKVRYSIRYPNEVQDQAEEMQKQGGYINRRAMDLLTGRITLDELIKRGDNE